MSPCCRQNADISATTPTLCPWPIEPSLSVGEIYENDGIALLWLCYITLQKGFMGIIKVTWSDNLQSISWVTLTKSSEPFKEVKGMLLALKEQNESYLLESDTAGIGIAAVVSATENC